MNTQHSFRKLADAAIRGLTGLALLAGLVTVVPSLVVVPAHAADAPIPLIIDYVLVSSTSNTDFLSTTDLQERTDKVSEAWQRMSRGMISDVRIGHIYTLPNSTVSACNIGETDPGLVAAMGHSSDEYDAKNNGHHLVILGDPNDDSCVGLGTIGGFGLASSGVVWMMSTVSPVTDATTMIHELGHNLGLFHTAVGPTPCPRGMDGPFTFLNQVVTPEGCPVYAYGDNTNIMGNGGLGAGINGAQEYRLGVVGPGRGLENAIVSDKEQVFTIQDGLAPHAGVTQTVRLTGDDPDGRGPCTAPVYHMDYDSVVGGVQVLRIPQETDCGSEDAVGRLDSIAWSVTTQARNYRSYLLPGESRVNQSGNMQIKVMGVDAGSNTATVSVRRTDVRDNPTLQVDSMMLDSDQTIRTGAAGRQVIVAVTTNQPSWAATTDQSWVTVAPSGQKGDLLVTAGPNPTAAERTAQVTVRAGNAEPKVFLVVQAPGPSRDDCGDDLDSSCVLPDTSSAVRGGIEAPGDRDGYVFKPTVTGKWSFTVSGSGGLDPEGDLTGHDYRLRPNTTRVALGQQQFQVTADLVAGNLYTFYVSGTGTTSGTYTVTAVPPAATLDLYGRNPWEAAGGGDRTYISVNSNAAWELGPLPDWLHPSRKSGWGGQYTLITAEPNTGSDTRTASLTFSVPGQTVTIPVSQTPGTVPPEDCGDTAHSACDGADLNDQSRTKTDFIGDRDWFKITPGATGSWTFKTTGQATVYTTILASDGSTPVSWAPLMTPSSSETSAVLTAGNTYYLQVDGLGTPFGKYAVAITPPQGTTISVSPSTWEAPGAGGQQAVDVTSDSAWEVTLPDWVTADPPTRTGNTTITLTAQPNTTGASRDGSVVFTTQDGKQASVSITQAALPPPPVDDCGDTPGTACRWAGLGEPFAGQLETQGDKDWTGFTPDATGRWTLTMVSLAGTSDPYVILRTAQGTEIASNNGDSSPAQRVSVAAELLQGTDYYLEVGSRSGDTGPYHLVAAAPSEQPITVSPASWTPSAPGDTVEVRVTATSMWRLYTSSWVSASQWWGVGDATVTLTALPRADGEPYDGNAWFGTMYGAVEVTISWARQSSQPDADCGITLDTVCEWSNLSQPLAGNLEVGWDRDRYRFTPTASGTWTFTSSGGVRQPQGALYGPSGTLIAVDHNPVNNRPFSVTAELEAGVTYYLEVLDNRPGTYTVTATAG